jgi:phosphate transport system substrate-binding protein
MTKWLLAFLTILAVVVGLSIGFGRNKGAALNVIGSTSVQPFAEVLAQEYEKTHPGEYVDVQGGGSTAGLQAVINGIADIGTCSRGLTEKEKAETFEVSVAAPNGSVSEKTVNLEATVIARDGLAIVVHPSNPVSNLTTEQVRLIFEGQRITNWKQVGGDDRPIRLITREEGSGTREAFMKLVMQKSRVSRKALNQESNGAVKELVRNDRAAIGYMSLGLVKGELKPLDTDGVAPTPENVLAGRYRLVRPFLFVTRGSPSEKARRFTDYVLSPPAQAILEKEGLVGGEKRKTD